MTFPRRVRRLVRAAVIAAAVAAPCALGAAALAEPSKAGFAPDPPGNASRTQWVLDLTYRAGKPTVDRVRPLVLQNAASSARVFGRYAVELYIGRELLDRVRFDVPLTGDGPREPSIKRLTRRPSFENVTTRLHVTIADHPRATYVQLLDRATGDAVRFLWPPEPDGRLLPLPAAAATDAGPASAAAPASDGGRAADAAPASDAAPAADAAHAGDAGAAKQ